MIFTDKFVYVHEPKTGGTFVTSVLLRLHGIKWNRLTHLKSILRPNLVYKTKYGTFIYNNNKHGGCNEIPEAQRHEPILATIRNPYDLYVSEYEFGWWKRGEFLEYYRQIPGFQQTYARFPDLSFEEYLNLTSAAFGVKSNGNEGDRVGLQTEKFVKFYFKNPQGVLSQINDEYIAAQNYRADIHDLHFVRTDNLNRGLYDFLIRMEYPEEDVRFILDLGKILPQGKGRTKGQKWEKYYTPKLRQRVRRSDRLIFTMFPEFDV
ncbi:MAG: sulfotransferase family 2 domain-containing protein [Pyrinomonadaceae bacterium]|nr:sulfotransferase family 2 domain-containing protein [Pyrinomonadaceae bacterium]